LSIFFSPSVFKVRAIQNHEASGPVNGTDFHHLLHSLLYEPKVSKMVISLRKDVKKHPNFYADKGDRPSSPTAKGRSQAHLSAKSGSKNLD